MVKIDLIVIGNFGSGKTSLIARYVDSQSPFVHNYLPTLGMNLQKKELIIKDQKLNVCLWDTAGQDKFFSLTKSYFQQADGVVLVFDICDLESFKRIDEYWLRQVEEYIKQNAQAILVGNKLDMAEHRKVKYIQGQELAQRHGMKYFEASAKTGEGVQEAYDYLAKICADKIEGEINDYVHPNITIQQPQNKPTRIQQCINFFTSPFTSDDKKNEDES